MIGFNNLKLLGAMINRTVFLFYLYSSEFRDECEATQMMIMLLALQASFLNREQCFLSIGMNFNNANTKYPTGLTIHGETLASL